MKTYKQYLNESAEQIDYDNSPFEKIWNYENKDCETLKSNDNNILTGKFRNKDSNSIVYLDSGNLHRIDGPAVIDHDGILEWWVKGKPHRDDGPAVITWENDKKHKDWFLNGNLINESYPANVPKKMQKMMIEDNPQNTKLILNPSREIQEYIILNHPEYINNLKYIDNNLKQKYSDIISSEDLGI